MIVSADLSRVQPSIRGKEETGALGRKIGFLLEMSLSNARVGESRRVSLFYL